MRYISLMLIVAVLASGIAVGQEARSRSAGGAQPDSTRQSYFVRLTEFRMASGVEFTATASDIVESFQRMKAARTLDVISTVRLSALEGQESSARFGKRIAIAVSSPVSREAASRNTTVQMQEFGTSVKLQAMELQGRILLHVEYEATRLKDGTENGIAPETELAQYESKLLMDRGVPVLVGGTSEEATSYLLVTIEK